MPLRSGFYSRDDGHAGGRPTLLRATVVAGLIHSMHALQHEGAGVRP